MTLSMLGLFATLSINDTQLSSNECYYADCPIFYCYVKYRYAECRYAERRYAECRYRLGKNKSSGFTNNSLFSA